MNTRLVVAVLAGCGFSPSASSDAPRALDTTPGGEGAGTDSSVDANQARTRPCMERWHQHDVVFETPVELSELGSGANPQSDPFISFDEKTIFFVGTAPSGGSAEIYSATRPDLDHPFTGSTPFLPADGSASQSKLSMTQDGAVFVVASNRDPATSHNNSLDLFLATEQTPGNYTSPAEDELQQVDDNDNQFDPQITLDGLAIYFAPDTGGQQHIYVSSRGDIGDNFQSKVIVQGVNGTDAADEDPAVSADGSVMVFSSHRNPTSVDLYYATRTVPAVTPDAGFGSALPITGVNTDDGEGDPVLGSDGCRIYFESARTGSNEIYEATMTTP